MKIAIPVGESRGLESPVYGHFGSAPAFVLVDSETLAIESLGNRDQVHEHGQCRPLQAFAGTKPDAVAVRGIGAGALRGLRSAGIRVYQTSGQTVAEVVTLLGTGDLKEIDEQSTCAGHGGDSGCPHPHN
jgi:predicted Fe-Mo cluster-binding NifX family protein